MRRIAKLMIAATLLLAPLSLAAPSQASSGLPAGTCHASQGCGCGGVYVLKYKFILVHC